MHRYDVHPCSFIFHGFVVLCFSKVMFVTLFHLSGLTFFMPSNCSQISVRTVDVVNEVRVILCATWPKSGIKSTFFHNWNLFCKGSSLQFCIHQKNPAHFQMDPKGLPYCSFTSSSCSSMFGTVRTASMSPVASSSQPQIPVTLHSAGLCVH